MSEEAVYTLAELSTHLLRQFAAYRPHTVSDKTDKDVRVLEFILPHPTEPHISISLQAEEYRGYADNCALHFGHTEIAKGLSPDMAAAAIESILADQVIAVVHYKSEDAYDNRRPSGLEWLYQLTGDQDDDGEALDKQLRRIRSKPAWWEKATRTMVGVFEINRWSGCEVVKRK